MSNKCLCRNLLWTLRNIYHRAFTGKIYLFKPNNRGSEKWYKICSNLKIKTPERHQWLLLIGDVFKPRTSNIYDTAFLRHSQVSSIVDVWLGSNYVYAYFWLQLSKKCFNGSYSLPTLKGATKGGLTVFPTLLN